MAGGDGDQSDLQITGRAELKAFLQGRPREEAFAVAGCTGGLAGFALYQ